MLDYYRFKDIDDLYCQGETDKARQLLMSMQSRYISLCDENSFMRMQLHEFEDILYLSRNLIFDGDCYWLITGGIKQGPFCAHCYDQDGALIRLDSESGEWRCVSCGTLHRREAEQPGQTILSPAPKAARHTPLYK